MMGGLGVGSTVCIFLISVASALAQNARIDSLTQLLKNPGLHDTTRINLLNDLSFEYIHLNPSIAQDDVAIAFNLAKKINYTKGIAFALNNFGAIHWSMGEYSRSLENYLLAMDQFREIGYELGISYCYNNIGEVYKKLGDLDKALENMLLSIEINERLLGDTNTLLSYSNVAEIYFLRGDTTKALNFYEKVIDNASFASNKELAYAYSGLGDIALARDDFSKAGWYYGEAEKLRSAVDDSRGLSAIYKRKGILFRKQRLYDSSEFYLHKSAGMANLINGKDLIVDVHLQLSKTFTQKGQFKEALDHYYEYTILKDSLINEGKLNQIIRMEAEYKNALLQKENQMYLENSKQQNMIILGIVMLMLLSLAVAATFYKQQKGQQKVNFLLASKNQEINDQKLKIQSQAERLAALNKKLSEVNENLEAEVKERTKLLLEQNRKLAAYAYTNAHELRAPVANILGLIHLLSFSKLSETEAEMVHHLSVSAHDLDNVISAIRKNLEDDQEIS